MHLSFLVGFKSPLDSFQEDPYSGLSGFWQASGGPLPSSEVLSLPQRVL